MAPNQPVVHAYGDTLKSHQVAGLRLAETNYAPGLRVPWHSHESAYFSLVLAGTFDGVYGRIRQSGKPLQAVFRPAGEPHSVTFHRTGARLFSVQVEPHQLKSATDRPLGLDRSIDLAGGLLAWLAFRMYREVQTMDEASSLSIEGLFLEMLAEASRRAMPRESHLPLWLARAKEIIHDRFSEPLTIAGIAEDVNIHPVHLATIFRRHYRCTIGDYIRRLRIEDAGRKLSLSDASLVEIALSAGFADQSHFSRTFKQFTGFTPRRFRALCRGA